LDPLVKKLEQLKFGDDEEQEENKASDDEDELDQASTRTNDSETSVSDPDSKSSDSEHDSESSANDHDMGVDIRSLPMIDAFMASRFDEEAYEEIEYPFGSKPKSLDDVAHFILSDKCKSIVILAGAGMSVTSGIPDYRSAGGLYHTLQPDLLTASSIEREAMRADPTVALEQGLFLQNPLPCLEVKRPFILGTHDELWKATIAHRLVELLHSKTGKLTRLYTQNIDGLEGQCHNLPREKVVAVHGSMDRAECAVCGVTSDFGEFCNQVRTNIKDVTGQDATAPPTSTPIRCQSCGHNSVKPAIVLFRSKLPEEFFDRVPQDIPNVDLLFVIGTSLAVAPANTLVFRVPQTALRVVINDEPVGWRVGIEYGSHARRDYFAQGRCDDVALDLIEKLGWLNDLAAHIDDLPDESSKRVRNRLSSMDPRS
jgi:NAD-dependent deacetylase sirtuin 2